MHINSYHAGRDSRDNSFPQHTSDEVHKYKGLEYKYTLGLDELSWKVHSPDVLWCDHMSVKCEESKHVKSHLDYSDKKGKSKINSHIIQGSRT